MSKTLPIVLASMGSYNTKPQDQPSETDFRVEGEVRTTVDETYMRKESFGYHNQEIFEDKSILTGSPLTVLKIRVY